MKVTDKFVLFWRDYLGNWSTPPTPIKYFDINWKGPIKDTSSLSREFKTSEHLFMYLKARFFRDYEVAEKIVAASSPKEAKDLGRSVRGFNERAWETVREDAMFTALYHRYMVDTKFKNILLKPEYENLKFVEASPYDKIWGIGASENDPIAWNESFWPGKNLLGKCLNECRRYLKFREWVSKWEEHVFFEDLIWCPSQIEYYFTDVDGTMYVVYMRWRHSDPWRIELCKVKDPKSPTSWDFDLMDEELDLGEFSDLEYKVMERSVIEYLKKRFPGVAFPDKAYSKNLDDWSGMNLI